MLFVFINMKHITKIDNAQLIKLKDKNWLEKQRIAGTAVKSTLSLLQSAIDSNLTLLELDMLAEDNILKHNCTPTFKNYKGFPNSVCISTNKQLVHGIPSNYKLQSGDIVSFDLGATYQGAIADAARTHIIGVVPERVKLLVETTKEALSQAIAQIRLNNNLGSIGYTINKVATSKGFNVITNYGGHGLCWNKPHTNPFVTNKCNKEDGIKIVPGLTIAIEPLICIGDPKTSTGKDGWVVTTNDINSHEENTIYISEEGVEVIT